MANVPLGDFKPMTDDQIDGFIIVSEADIELLRSTWKKHASRRYADLIDATATEDVLNLDADS